MRVQNTPSPPVPVYRPPAWWAPLLYAIAAADAAYFAAHPDAERYEREAVPGEVWPSPSHDNLVVIVTRTRRGVDRRLVFREVAP